MSISSKSFNALKSLNKRMHTFFELEKVPKINFLLLAIDQLPKGAVRFQFLNKGVSDGYMHIVTTKNGEEERIRYCAKKKDAARQHVETKYGVFTRKPSPILLPPVLIKALEEALHKFSYDNFSLESVVINIDMLNNLCSGRTKNNDELHIDKMFVVSG